MRLVYIPFQEWNCTDAEAPFITYGIRCCLQARPHTVLCCFHDVSADARFAEDLARLCSEEQLDPCHFPDVFYDLSP